MTSQQSNLFERKVFDGRVKRLTREFPNLSERLSEVPCVRCFEQFTCSDEAVKSCPKLTAWLLNGGN